MNKVSTFVLSALLKRTVLDKMTVNVRASSLDHAYSIAQDFFKNYPENTKLFGRDVPFCAIEERTNQDSELLDLEVEQDIGAA